MVTCMPGWTRRMTQLRPWRRVSTVWCVCVCVCVCVCMYECVCVHVHVCACSEYYWVGVICAQ